VTRRAKKRDGRPSESPPPTVPLDAVTDAVASSLQLIATLHSDLAKAYGDLASNAQNYLAVSAGPSVHALVPDDAPDYLTAADVGELLQVSERTVHRLVADGNLPEPIKISPGRSRWSRRALDEHFANGGGK